MPLDIQPKKSPTSFSTEERWSRKESDITLPPVRETEIPIPRKDPAPVSRKKYLRNFFLLLFFLLLGGGVVFFPGLLERKEEMITKSESGAKNLSLAADFLKQSNFEEGEKRFHAAYEDFGSARSLLPPGGNLLDLLRFIPGLQKISSGKNLIEAGIHLSRAGQEFSGMALLFRDAPTATTAPGSWSLLHLLSSAYPSGERALLALQRAESKLDRVRTTDLPLEKREEIDRLKRELPTVIALLELSLKNTTLFEELLGGNGPRKYLFLFQNNHELRATGGFIGSYALLDMSEGKARKFFVDGIFNPDGQLKENIVPPKPIQKVSAGWSLHDSNWFPDFPHSAEKAIFFYEKTGGATVDGIITFTPTILERLLKVTGPIALPEYGVTIDAENFISIIQEEVEVNYDRVENNPKKILSDLMDALLERLLLVPDVERFKQVAEAFVTGLNERHILLYSRHHETEALIDAAGWSGRVLSAPHDYLSVIHTNINGYKTDGVIEEDIKHESIIEEDGSIIDTVTITRKHTGGSTPYEWWNKVNADYLRVYVPLGSELLSAEGMTREFPEEPLDYTALGFKRDSDVVREEEAIIIDEESGTRIGKDAGKTVFGNWVYVSPQESVTVTYRYKLPFKVPLKTGEVGDPLSHSVLYQKQAGTAGVRLTGSIRYPEGFAPVWQTGENLIPYGQTIQFKTTLDENQFLGLVLKKQ